MKFVRLQLAKRAASFAASDQSDTLPLAPSVAEAVAKQLAESPESSVPEVVSEFPGDGIKRSLQAQFSNSSDSPSSEKPREGVEICWSIGRVGCVFLASLCLGLGAYVLDIHACSLLDLHADAYGACALTYFSWRRPGGGSRSREPQGGSVHV